MGTASVKLKIMQIFGRICKLQWGQPVKLMGTALV